MVMLEKLNSSQCMNRVSNVYRAFDPQFFVRQFHGGVSSVSGKMCLAIAGIAWIEYQMDANCFRNNSDPAVCILSVNGFKTAVGCCGLYIIDLIYASAPAE
jgi:hypothetical protein